MWYEGWILFGGWLIVSLMPQSISQMIYIPSKKSTITDYFSQLVNHNMSIQIIWCVRRGCNSSWGNGISFLLRRSTAVNCGKSLTTLCTILGTGNGSINRHCRRHRLSSSSLLSIHNYIIIMTPQSDNDSGPCNSIKFYLHANNNNNHQRNHNK